MPNCRTNAHCSQAQFDAQRKGEISAEVSRFFARYTTTPTADQIVAATKRFNLSKYAKKRILDVAAGLRAPAAATPRRPAAPANGSIYFDTPGAVTASPGGGLDPLPFILAAAALVFLLRR